jgi:hypothetical protein
MPIPFQCPGCQTQLNAPDTAAGKQITCSRCRALVAVPQPVAAAAPTLDLDDEPTPAPVKKSGTAPRPAAKPPAPPPESLGVDDDEPAEERPARKSGTVPRPAARKRLDDDEDGGEMSFRKRRAAAAGGPPVALVLTIAVLVGLGIVGGVSYTAYALFISKSETSSGGGSGGGGGGASKAKVPSGWKEFRFPDSGFKAYFPIEPFMQADRFSDQRLYEGLDRARTRYTISARRMVAEGDPKPFINGIIDQAQMNGFEVKELGRREVTWAGYPATEVVFESTVPAGLDPAPPDPKLKGKKTPPKAAGPTKPVTVMRLMFAEGRFYTARIDPRNDRAKPEDENGFFDNFEVLK